MPRSGVDEQRYFEVIYRKTAKLFEAGAQIAAILAGAPASGRRDDAVRPASRHGVSSSSTTCSTTARTAAARQEPRRRPGRGQADAAADPCAAHASLEHARVRRARARRFRRAGRGSSPTTARSNTRRALSTPRGSRLIGHQLSGCPAQMTPRFGRTRWQRLAGAFGARGTSTRFALTATGSGCSSAW